MKITEIIQPNIDRDLLLIETLRHSVVSEINHYYVSNRDKTQNYSVDAIDAFSFNELNRHIIIIQKLRNIVIDELGIDSEIYKIIEFLEEYFRY